MPEVGWPEPAFAAQRIESTRSCCPSSRQSSDVVHGPMLYRTVRSAREGRGRLRPPRREAARARSSQSSRGSATRSSISAPTPTPSRIDYPDKAREVGEAIRTAHAERGVLVCGSGRRRLGRRLQARRHPRCDLPRRLLRPPGRRARRHERALPRLRGRRAELAADLVRAFLAARFDGGERYVARLEKIEEWKKGCMNG